jgi:hypothetical protein
MTCKVWRWVPSFGVKGLENSDLLLLLLLCLMLIQ